MNANHGLASGHFCSRNEGRRIEGEGLTVDALVKLIERTMRGNEGALGEGSDGTCLVVQDGNAVELICLSAEGRAAWLARTHVGAEVAGHRGYCHGRQDPHNVRKCIRRWIERNPALEERGLALKAVRTEEGLNLSAVEA